MKDELRKINERMENDRADMVRMLEEMNRRSREDEERRAREGVERRMMEENERRRREEEERRRRERDDRRRRAHGERPYTPSYGSEESYYDREGEGRRRERKKKTTPSSIRCSPPFLFKNQETSLKIKDLSLSVSRVLSCTAIYLGLPSPISSSDIHGIPSDGQPY